MLSELPQAMIVNGAVLVAVLHSDLGSERKIGPVRILRPLVLAGAVIPLFVQSPATHGTGLAVELAGIAAGLLGGLVAVALMAVHRSRDTGRPVSRAGTPYALLWIVVIGARAAFSYGSSHQVTGAAITDALIVMAVAMLLTRTIGLGARAARLPAAATASGALRAA
jgi:hypothetical protein